MPQRQQSLPPPHTYLRRRFRHLLHRRPMHTYLRRRLRHPRASAPLSKKSALYQEVPKQQHLHEVSVVRFAAARRRRADWLPVRIVLRGANAATRAHVARVCACDKTRREGEVDGCCFCCRGRAASSRLFWRRRRDAPRCVRWRRRGVGAAINRAPAASGAARPPCGATCPPSFSFLPSFFGSGNGFVLRGACGTPSARCARALGVRGAPKNCLL